MYVKLLNIMINLKLFCKFLSWVLGLLNIRLIDCWFLKWLYVLVYVYIVFEVRFVIVKLEGIFWVVIYFLFFFLFGFRRCWRKCVGEGISMVK